MSEFLPGRSYIYSPAINSKILALNNINPIDVIEADLGELLVKPLRLILNQALTKPFGQHRLLWLRNAENASHINQNTLLKILEEPPATLIIIMEAKSTGRFLPTVRSRLYSVRESRAQKTQLTAVLPADSSSELGAFLRGITDRSTLASTLIQARTYQAEQFLASPNSQASLRVNLLEKAVQRLNLNANQKIIIDSLLLHWPSG